MVKGSIFCKEMKVDLLEINEDLIKVYIFIFFNQFKQIDIQIRQTDRYIDKYRIIRSKVRRKIFKSDDGEDNNDCFCG